MYGRTLFLRNLHPTVSQYLGILACPHSMSTQDIEGSPHPRGFPTHHNHFHWELRPFQISRGQHNSDGAHLTHQNKNSERFWKPAGDPEWADPYHQAQKTCHRIPLNITLTSPLTLWENHLSYPSIHPSTRQLQLTNHMLRVWLNTESYAPCDITSQSLWCHSAKGGYASVCPLRTMR